MARRRLGSGGIPENEQLRFPPERILGLLQQLKAALSLAQGRAIGLDDLEELTGRSAATIRSWCDGVRMHQIEFLFSLLERLPQRLRHDLVDRICRVTPSLSHPKLAHDPIAVDQLKRLLEISTGFTSIQGEPEHMRSFLLHALGNRRAPESRSIVGLEIPQISAWPAIPGMLQTSGSRDRREELAEAWTKLSTTKDGSLVLLGGQWHQDPGLQSGLLELGRRCHLVISDMLAKTQERARILHLPLRVITVAPAREQPEWIRVVVRGGTNES